MFYKTIKTTFNNFKQASFEIKTITNNSDSYKPDFSCDITFHLYIRFLENNS